MSQITDAWNETYDAATEWLGEARTATVNGITGKAIVSEMTMDEILAAGGTAEGGGFKLQMLASTFTTQPPKFAPAYARGTTLQVLNVNDNDGILYIDCGDPVAHE